MGVGAHQHDSADGLIPSCVQMALARQVGNVASRKSAVPVVYFGALM
ncbi:Hypothetical protein A7982_02375 [Minicystis rosea]|nr:Hypothetical protein A7982_02375 [Minicystis rosea]